MFFSSLPPISQTPEERYIDLKNAILEYVFEYGHIKNVQDDESLKICRELVVEGLFREPQWFRFDING